MTTASAPQPVTSAVAAALQGSLNDMLRLSLLVKHTHYLVTHGQWEVAEPRSPALQLQLDELAEVARHAADDLARRAVALGVPPEGRPDALPRSASCLRRGPVQDTGTGVVEDLLVLLGAVTQRAHRAIAGELAGDAVSREILRRIAAALDDQARLLLAPQR